MTTTASTTMTPISLPIAKQPLMDLYTGYTQSDENIEKAPAYHDPNHTHDVAEASQWSATGRTRASLSSHIACHNGRLRRLLMPALIALRCSASLVALAGFIALLCFFDEGGADLSKIIGGLFQVKRTVTGDGSGSTNSESAFTKHKLYLIVIFIGLLVVIILGVMLSAWCCKGAFENPCCCPCYLCACCGGLVCLECIGCGWCAEGVEQM
ncbi:hypothetical protein FB451DRAFT_1440779 [Mycena latifolia]|nr:hypothetical protein FB451DRAFT_1440779 [Mycena latifolia]